MSDDRKKHITYVCVGHCCHDVIESGYTLGGTASYSASVAHNLGAHAKIITAYGPDFRYEERIRKRGIEVVNIGSAYTTVFENIYGNGARQQFLHARAEKLTINEVTPYITDVDILHLSPIADEIDYSLISAVNSGLIGATIQGSMRCWDDRGKVFPCKMEWESLRGVDVVVISDEDIIGIHQALMQIREVVPLVVVTMGRKGATIFNKNGSLFVPSFRAEIRNETGAGDTFAAAFFIHYYKNNDPLNAVIYAHVVTSLVLERADGTFPSEAEINERLDHYHQF
jgi:sugar/nucleoside kinase (ribokinase family)